MRGVALGCSSFLQIHLAEMREGMGEHVRLVVFRHKSQDHVREALGHAGRDIRGVRRIGFINVFLHDFIDIAVKTVRHLAALAWWQNANMGVLAAKSAGRLRGRAAIGGIAEANLTLSRGACRRVSPLAWPWPTAGAVLHYA